MLGAGKAASVCGRLFADTGARVLSDAQSADANSSAFTAYLRRDFENTGMDGAAMQADIVVAEGSPNTLARLGYSSETIRRANSKAAIVLVSPYGQTGPWAEHPATDLTLLAASGIARMLTGQVDDVSEPPVRAVGGQAWIIGGIAAACAGMHALLNPKPAVADVSIHEALATLAMTELARAGQTGRSWQRMRLTDGNGATVCILPAKDGYAAISPREEKQWASWLVAMGSPEWGAEPRFARKPDRIANWDALHALMSEWSRSRSKREIASLAQTAHVPSFPLLDLDEQLDSDQLRHRDFFGRYSFDGKSVQVPGAPFIVSYPAGTVPQSVEPAPDHARSATDGPLGGVKVLDFSWVIAGPTATRHLAAMGADVIKVEAPGAGDPGRGSELHTVLGQAKKGVVLNLKQDGAKEIARRLASECDVLIENFATGVMDRLGLDPDTLHRINPNLIYLSASGLGRSGPEAKAVAYGTLLQCYAGFAGLNRFPDRQPRVGMAWLDPMCGLILPFRTAAAVWRQRHGHGQGVRIDFSMVEAMLWGMADPLLQAQQTGMPAAKGNTSTRFSPHGVYPAMGDDAWISLAVRSDDEWAALCSLVPGLQIRASLRVEERRNQEAAIAEAIENWSKSLPPFEAQARLLAAGIPAAAVAGSADLVASDHLAAREFWESHKEGVLPGLPWQSSFPRITGLAPAHGEHTAEVLQELLNLSDAEVEQLRQSGDIG